jgi:transcriptional regulator with XRE-family HTH domain
VAKTKFNNKLNKGYAIEVVLDCWEISDILISMATQPATTAPSEFIRLLKQSFDASGLTLTEVAGKAEISPAYLSRMLKGERGVPAIGIITRLEEVFDIQPRGQLFDAAGLNDSVVSKVLKKENGRVLLRSMGHLTDEDMATVLNVVNALAKNHAKAK